MGRRLGCSLLRQKAAEEHWHKGICWVIILRCSVAEVARILCDILVGAL